MMGRNSERARSSGPTRGAQGEHVLDRLQAYLDGELPRVDADAVHAHIRTCPGCARAWREHEAVWKSLSAELTPSPPPSLWPSIHARLAPAVSRRMRTALAAGGLAASLAGLVVGILLGSVRQVPQVTWQEETWTQVGSLLADESGTTLDDVYLAAAAERDGGAQ